jgi:hypothetical protein
MKQFIRWTLALALSTAVVQWDTTVFAQFFEGGLEQRSTLTVKSDGSCLFSSVAVQSRTATEQQVRMMERYEKMSEAAGEGDEEQMPEIKESTPEPKPFTDDELTRKVGEMLENRFGESGDSTGQDLKLEIKKDTVTIQTSRSFASLEEMLREGADIWLRPGVFFENVRFEQDSNSLLKVTLTPRSEMQRYFKNFRSQWKLSGTKAEMKLVFPGRVISSGFPESKTNATWLTIDPQKDESLEATIKLYEGPTVITAESAGLKIDHPLESKKLQREGRYRGEAGDALPIIDAGPGFVAEAQTITTTTLKIFPGGEACFKPSGRYAGQQAGTVVSAKLFAPKGRTMQSVSDVHVLHAVDEKGRTIPASQEDEEASSYRVYSGGPQEANSTQIQLRLQLPQPDAQAIDEITAEAVAVTAGTWKEMTLTNIQENATNELDLSDVLPGAKLIITKYSSKNNQLNIQARIKGPPTVKHLDIQAKIPGTDRFSSSLSERKFSAKGNESTRTIYIQGYGFSDEGHALAGPFVLVVRYPEDLRRERVNFKLKGLDLL